MNAAEEFQENIAEQQRLFALERERKQEMINRMTRWQRKQYRGLIKILQKQGIPEMRIEPKHIEPILKLKYGETNL